MPDVQTLSVGVAHHWSYAPGTKKDATRQAKSGDNWKDSVRVHGFMNDEGVFDEALKVGMHARFRDRGAHEQ